MPPPRQHGPRMIRRLLAPAAEPGQPAAKFEELLALYEEGMRLVKACGDRLTDAEQKVEILSRAVSAEGAKPGAAPEDDKPAEPKGDIRLF